jgi:hypothetical protein
MTAAPLTTKELRAEVVLAVERAVDSLDGGYAALMRAQVRSSEVASDAYGPAVFCLGLGYLINGSDEKALPAATSLALLEEMARVFQGLEAEPRSDLIDTWGMARSLNSGDGFFAAAQRVLIEDQGLAAEQRIGMLSTLTQAARLFAEALHQSSEKRGAGVSQPSAILYPHVVSLVAVACAPTETAARQLTAIAESLAAEPGSGVERALQSAAALDLRND